MKNIFRHPIHPLLAVLFLTFCGGQIDTRAQHDTKSEDQHTTTGKTKLVRTQGTDRYALVRCAIQDRKGNIWFGTTGEGVYRYDGRFFTQFTVKDGLNDNRVWSLLEDRKGDIWFGTTNGLCRRTGENIINIPIPRTFSPSTANDYYNDASRKNTIWSMLQDTKGRIWFGSGDGVYCCDGKDITPFLDDKTILNPPGLRLKMVDCISEDANGNIWFGSGMPPGMEGLCRYDGNTLTSFTPGGEKWIRYILEDKGGRLLIETRQNGLWRYDGKEFTKFPVAENVAITALIDRAGNYWFGGGENDNGYSGAGGIWKYDGTSFTNYTTKDGMGDFAVYCFLQDNKGNLWIGTRNTGLYRYDGKTFTRFSE